MGRLYKIHILRTGTFPDGEGDLQTYNPEDLELIAKSYNPGLYKAKIVLGHNEDLQAMFKGDSAPAFGEVISLEKQGNNLWANAKLDDEFADLLEKDPPPYGDRSAAFYASDSKFNPTPGKQYLRHIAFLGATPPAIKGLGKLVRFGENFSTDIKQIRNMENIQELVKRLLGSGGFIGNINVIIPDEDDPNTGCFTDDDDNNYTYTLEYSEKEGNCVSYKKGKSAIQYEEIEVPSEDSPPEEQDAFLKQYAQDFLISLLEEGDQGYKGEINDLDPIPSEENEYLYDADKDAFIGKFYDPTSDYPDGFNFYIRKLADGTWEKAYKPVESGALTFSEGEEVKPDKSDEEETDVSDEEGTDVSDEEETETPDEFDFSEIDKLLSQAGIDVSQFKNTSDDEDKEVTSHNEPVLDETEEEDEEEEKESDDPDQMSLTANILEVPDKEYLKPLDSGDETYLAEGKLPKINPVLESDDNQEVVNALRDEVRALRSELLTKTKDEMFSYAENLYTSGKLIESVVPRNELVDFLMLLNNSFKSINFSESSKEKPIDWFKNLLSSVTENQQAVVFGEMEEIAENPELKTQFTKVAAGYSVDPGKAEIHQKALAFCEKNGTDCKDPTQYVKAVAAVS